MKTNLLKTVVLAASLLVMLTPASAETLYARIPFGFSASGTIMPAGPYAIRPIPNTHSILLFENEETKEKVLVFARVAYTAPAQAAAPLMFASGISDGVALTNIATAAWTYELSMHPIRASLKGATLVIASAK
jgi:hypothetical protein